MNIDVVVKMLIFKISWLWWLFLIRFIEFISLIESIKWKLIVKRRKFILEFLFIFRGLKVGCFLGLCDRFIENVGIIVENFVLYRDLKFIFILLDLYFNIL